MISQRREAPCRMRSHKRRCRRALTALDPQISTHSSIPAMPELILAIHHGPHDAVAAVLADYELKAAVQLERLTRFKGDGRYPDLSIEEALGMIGATRRDVDVL